MVLGQPNPFTNLANIGGINANTAAPRMISAFDLSGNLWVADEANNRVLEFPSANLITNGVANVVLGQGNFITGTANLGGIGGNTLSFPMGLSFDTSGNLWVTDEANNRVLKFPTGNLITNGVANVVLGQPSFITSTANIGGIGANTLNVPHGGLSFDLSGTSG